MRTINRVAVRLVFGIAVAFLAAMGTIVLSALSGAPSTIPYVFSAAAGDADGLPSIEFVLNGHGLACAIMVVAVAYTLSELWAPRTRRLRSRAFPSRKHGRRQVR